MSINQFFLLYNDIFNIFSSVLSVEIRTVQLCSKYFEKQETGSIKDATRLLYNMVRCRTYPVEKIILFICLFRSNTLRTLFQARAGTWVEPPMVRKLAGKPPYERVQSPFWWDSNPTWWRTSVSKWFLSTRPKMSTT